MQIIEMIDDYARMVEESKTIGKFNAYKAYTEKFPDLFGFIFEHLYMQPISALQGLIEQADFECLLKQGLENRRIGMARQIVTSASAVADDLDFDKDFRIYLGMELGNIGGCLASVDPARPALFIGTEVTRSAEFINQIVPHEFNHMVRASAVGADLSEINTVLGRAMAEGLAVYYDGLAFNHQPFSDESFALQNGLSQAQIRYLSKSGDSLLTEMETKLDLPPTEALHRDLFIVNSGDDQSCVPGYYYGTSVIARLVESGQSLAELTRLPFRQIYDAYLKLK